MLHFVLLCIVRVSPNERTRHFVKYMKMALQAYLESVGDLIDAVFPTLGTDNDLIDGAIYTPLNCNAAFINGLCLNRLPGESKVYLSADKIMEVDHQEEFPSELLNTITVSGLPDHELELKEECPVILIRNLQGGPNNSLKNGTRMTVVKMMDRVLECEIAIGAQKGKRVFLPRIPMTDKSNEFPFTLVRRQFPVKLAFCLTINKVKSFSTLALALARASVLEVRMRTCVWGTHFEVCLEPYSSQTVSLTIFVKKQKLLEMPCNF